MGIYQGIGEVADLGAMSEPSFLSELPQKRKNGKEMTRAVPHPLFFALGCGP